MVSNGLKHKHPAEPEMIFVQGGAFYMGYEALENDSGENDKPSHLLTEAEWEYAARGGYEEGWWCAYNIYSGSDEPDHVCWYDENSGGSTQPVGKKRPNVLGIYDMSGNVNEWCNDWWGDDTDGFQYDPKGAASGVYRVFRGGCWKFGAESCRSVARDSIEPGSRASIIGFRVACSANERASGKNYNVTGEMDECPRCRKNRGGFTFKCHSCGNFTCYSCEGGWDSEYFKCLTCGTKIGRKWYHDEGLTEAYRIIY